MSLFYREENTIRKLELQTDFLESYVSFLKYICGIWNWGLAYSFLNYAIQIVLIYRVQHEYISKKEIHNWFLGVKMSCFEIYIARKWILISLLEVLILFLRGPNLQCRLVICLWNKNNAPLNKGIEAKAKSVVVRENPKLSLCLAQCSYQLTDARDRVSLFPVCSQQANSENT